MQSPLIACPPAAVGYTHEYRITPRSKRTYNTVLDARVLVDPDPSRRTVVRMASDEDGVTFGVHHPVIGGQIDETLLVGRNERGLVAKHLTRSVFAASGTRVRYEEVDFTDPTIRLPETAYPEVLLPFLLSWQPFDGQTRSLHAWINDRFVAKVQYESKGLTTVDLPIGRRQAMHMMMYPDFNDWVPMPSLLARLAKPFAPKYHMWFDPQAPHTVLRFEGPYGPPGAPEIVLEMLA